MTAHVAEVIRRLRTIETSASPSDGVVCFARLYREVTEDVHSQLAREGFADPRFLETLDVRFAGLFFSALDAHEHEPARTPSAWFPLLAQRSRRGIAPIVTFRSRSSRPAASLGSTFERALRSTQTSSG